MKALLKEKRERGFTLKETNPPAIGPGDVLVEVKAAAICGSDLNFYLWNPWCEKVVKALPFIPGHEGCGIVAEVGEGVNALRKGDKVAFETHLPCGNCYQCTTGSPHICQRMELFGHTFDGCFAEFCRVPQVIVRKIPDALSFESAALLEPMGVALRAVLEGEVRGDSIAVIGCGPIGLLTVLLARKMGATRIFAIERNKPRLTIAASVGASDPVDPNEVDFSARILAETAGNGVGVVVDASGNSKAISSGFKALRKGGKFFMIGNPQEPVVLDGIEDIVHKEATIRGLHGREMFGTWQRAEALMLDETLDIESLITHRLNLQGFDAGFQACLRGEACKVLLRMN